MKSLGYIFPGQGSQKKGMLSIVYDNYEVFRDTLSISNDILGYNLWDIILNDENKLNNTLYAQPALLATSIALWNVIGEKQNNIKILLGHSLGEYSALVAGGVLEFSDAISLVAKRAKYMQDAVPVGHGGMAAIIGLDDQKVVDICNEIDGIVSAANFNAPGQVVIAGESKAVSNASDELKSAGAKKVMPLAVSVPSHCELMKDAAELFSKEFDNIKFNDPKCKIIFNTTASVFDNVKDIKSALKKQLFSPVRWSESIKNATSLGANTLAECGAGNVLSNLNKRIDKSITSISLSKDGILESFINN